MRARAALDDATRRADGAASLQRQAEEAMGRARAAQAEVDKLAEEIARQKAAEAMREANEQAAIEVCTRSPPSP